MRDQTFRHHPAQFAWTKPLLDCVRCKNTANTSVGGCEGPVPSILAPSSEQYHGQISRPDRRPGCDVTDHVMPETVGVLRRHRQCCRDSRWSSSSFFQLMLYGETRVYMYIWRSRPQNRRSANDNRTTRVARNSVGASPSACETGSPTRLQRD